MGSSGVSFKTDFNPPVRKPATDTAYRPAQSERAQGGYWLRRQDRPIRARIVNPKKERNKLARWILIWAVGIPLAGISIAWLVLLIIDLFTT
ncbi:MAG: hypothetical protein WBS20_13735 [Lysobacterales bacterium]